MVRQLHAKLPHTAFGELSNEAERSGGDGGVCLLKETQKCQWIRGKEKYEGEKPSTFLTSLYTFCKCMGESAVNWVGYSSLLTFSPVF